MTDGESATPPARRRPTYGLPGPAQSPLPGTGTDGDPSAGDQTGWGAPASPYGAPASPYGAYSSPAPHHGAATGQGSAPEFDGGSSGSSPAGFSGGPTGGAFGPAPGGTGSFDGTGSFGGPMGGAGPQGSPAPRRRGLVPLIIGLVLLIIIAPLFAIGGILWSVGSLTGDVSEGPTAMSGGTAQIEVAANEMILVYVPSEDAASTTCTAEAADGSSSLSTVSLSGTTQFGDGSSYEQTLGVAALEDTTVTIACDGTDAPAYLGPYDLLGIAAPMLIGPIIGVLAGLVGLILTIIGIVRLVQTRRR